MSDLQVAKSIVHDFYAALDAAGPDGMASALACHCHEDLRWRGFYPFHELKGPQEVAEKFWIPLSHAFNRMQRRLDIFFGGLNQLDGQTTLWVASMGHLMGLFDNPWLAIAPTRKIAMLRYAAFHRIKDGKIAETAMYFDIPHLMMQAGQNPFPPQTGAHLVQPGPATHDGLLFAAQDAEAGQKTLSLINSMCENLRNSWESGGMPKSDDLRRSWHDDMIWWGPAGIGATRTIDRYIEQHAEPFRKGLGDRQFNGHICRIAEGNFGGFFGWPNLTVTGIGGFMGMPATKARGDMRVIDIYRRDGDKLAENWIFIDLLHFWQLQGLDVLERMAAFNETQMIED